MSDNQKPKTYQELRNEFTQLCAKAGSVQYQIYAFQRDLEQLNNALRDINITGAQMLKAEQAAAAQSTAEAPQTAEAPNA